MSENIKLKTSHKQTKCCVRNCESRFQEGIRMHSLPKCETVRVLWLQWLSECNEINENVRKTACICEKHFRKEDYLPNYNPNAKKSLKNIAIPSIHIPPSDASNKKFTPTILKNGPTVARSANSIIIENSEMQIDLEPAETIIEDLPPDDEADAMNLDDCKKCYQALDASFEDNDSANTNDTSSQPQAEVDVHSQEYKELGEEEARLVDQMSKRKSISLMNLLRNDEDLIAFTGIDFALLDSLTAAVQECEDENCAKKFSNPARDRIVLCFCKLRLNLPFRCLAVLFGMTRQTCRNNFIYMLELLSVILEDFIYWPTHDEILESVPECFRKYKNTYVVLDCTEVPVEKPRCLKCRLRLYSHYKGCETIKFLIGTAPCGAITCISDAFGGRASDKAIFNHSDLLKKLEPTRDAIMADKGFDIEYECMSNHIKLIMPPKLKQKSQFSQAETEETQDIAAARIHIERSIQRFKMFKIVKHKISWTLVSYIDKISRVVAAIVNLKSPLLADNKF